jgi:hypothetical protein
MSDTAKSLLIFLLVLSPLYIPIAVTIVGAIADRRETIRTRWRSAAATSRPAIAITPRPHLDAPLTESDIEAA